MEIKKYLIEEQKRLQGITNTMRKELANAPKGSLGIRKSKKGIQYYHIGEKGQSSRTYISSKDRSLAKSLAQKTYHKKILAYSEKTSKQLENLLKIYEDDKVEEIYKSTHPIRQLLITPVEPTYEQRLEKWLSIPYIGKGFAEVKSDIRSNGGTRVRSKSEKLLANYFESRGIKYKYECPLVLKPYGAIYPDFTFLSPKTGKEIYWEHEGQMDNPDYARKAVKKIALYESNGIFCGERLILTFETSDVLFSNEQIDALINRYLV